jgi:hypothetical protein
VLADYPERPIAHESQMRTTERSDQPCYGFGMEKCSPGFVALWLVPLAATVPLAIFFSVPGSPLFLGKLTGEQSGSVFLLPHLGPWLSLAAIVFDATLLGYVVIAPVWLLLKAAHVRVERWPLARVASLLSLAGIGLSFVVRATQNFQQPGLRLFATSWLSPLFGCLCGLSAAAGFAWLIRQRWLVRAGRALYVLPGAVLLVCAILLMHFRPQP